jgi:hypothetical protein
MGRMVRGVGLVATRAGSCGNFAFHPREVCILSRRSVAMGPDGVGRRRNLAAPQARSAAHDLALRQGPRVEAGLRELIAKAEHRLEMLESMDKQKSRLSN